MCGILGIYQWHKNSITNDLLDAALNTMERRGPDGKNIWKNMAGTVVLGHRRLSIIDLQGGTQPISNADNSIIISVNGEFYDHADIRQDLIAKGYIFKTQSDSEIALHLYDAYGMDFLNMLRGEFAFILWDAKQQKMIAARDRFGIKPLCYTTDENGIKLASKAKALFAMGVEPKWDIDAFTQITAMQYTLPTQTLFKGVQQIKPGHYLEITQGQITEKQYWDMDYVAASDQKQQSEAAWIDDIETALYDAVKTRLRADVPLCVHLSGGLDSSTILGMANDIAGKSLPAFTVSFDADGYDELAIAKRTAEIQGSPLNIVPVHQDDLVSALADAVYASEGLGINGHMAAKYLLNQQIEKAGYKVALTGEGSDEIFAGYPHLRQDLLTQTDNTDQLMATNTASAGLQLALGAGLNTDAITEKLGFTPAFLKAKASLGNRCQNLLQADFKAQNHQTDPFANFIQNTFPMNDNLGKSDKINQSMYLWSKSALCNYILNTLGDGMEMAHAIEGRLPFLDHKLFEIVREMPSEMKIKNMDEKYVLKQAAKKYITAEVYKRQKHPFLAPPLCAHRDSRLHQLIADTISSQNFKNQPFFDQGKAMHLLDALPKMEVIEQNAQEPILMLILTTTLLQQRMKITA